MEDWHLPYSPSPLPSARNVLVLAPHPDDEIFGCGGSLALYRRNGASIHVYVLSDGAGYAEPADRAAIYRTRQAETNAALASFGVGPAEFLGLPDRCLGAQANLSSLVAEKVKQYQIDVILAPSMWEIHPDHLATFRAAWAALCNLLQNGEPVPVLLLYEVGAPQFANLLVDITEVWAEKQSAMLMFPSQLAHQDYKRHIQALNTYRTYTLPASVRYAEALTLVTPDQLVVPEALGFDPIRHMMHQRMDSAMISAEASNSILKDALEKQAQELLAAEAVLRQTTSHLEKTRYELNEAGISHQSLVAQLANAQQERDEVRQQLASMLNSRAWRFTAPLRWFSRWVRHFR